MLKHKNASMVVLALVLIGLGVVFALRAGVRPLVLVGAMLGSAVGGHLIVEIRRAYFQFRGWPRTSGREILVTAAKLLPTVPFLWMAWVSFDDDQPVLGVGYVLVAVASYFAFRNRFHKLGQEFGVVSNPDDYER